MQPRLATEGGLAAPLPGRDAVLLRNLFGILSRHTESSTDVGIAFASQRHANDFRGLVSPGWWSLLRSIAHMPFVYRMEQRDLFGRKGRDAFTEARHGGFGHAKLLANHRGVNANPFQVSQDFVNGFHGVVLSAVDKVDNTHLRTRLTGRAEGSKKPIDKVNLLATIKITSTENAPDRADPSLGRHHSFNRLVWSIRTGGGEDGHT